MFKIITTNDGQQYRTQNFWNTAGAVAVGGATYSTAKSLLLNTTKPFQHKIIESARKADSVIIRKAINETLNNPEMRAKKLTLLDLSNLPKAKIPNPFNIVYGIQEKTSDLPKYTKEMLKLDKEVDNIIKITTPPIFRILKPLNELYKTGLKYALKEGQTAMCIPSLQKLIVNVDKIGAACFHEIGHSMNPKLNTAAVLISWLTPLVLGTALIKRKKLEGEEYKNKFDKATSFIKNNAAFIAMGIYVPLLGVELLASHKGTKLAKPLVNKETLNLIKSVQTAGAWTYVIKLAATGAAVFAASKVRDIISQPHKIQTEPKQNA